MRVVVQRQYYYANGRIRHGWDIRAVGVGVDGALNPLERRFCIGSIGIYTVCIYTAK